jgi:hypothetical protein
LRIDLFNRGEGRKAGMMDSASPSGVEPGLREPHDIEIITEPASGPRLARQPLAGVAGLVIVAGLVALLGIAPGRPQTALQVSLPLATFALSPLVMMTLWWQRWPTDRMSRPLSGLLNTLLLAGGAFVLAIAGQAVVGKVDLNGMFSQSTELSGGRLLGFPFTFPLAGLVFVAMVQITLVNERKPFDRLGRVASGLAALVTSWVVGLVAYGVLANWNAIPAAARSLVSLRNPDGPMNAVDIVGFLVCIVVWQVTFYLLLGGWPFNTIRNTGTRLFVANAGVLGSGWLTYLAMHNIFGWSIPVIGGVGGSIVAGVVLAALLFETWPFRLESPAAAALGLVVTVGAVATGAYWGLKGLGNGIQDWTQYPVELWVGTTALIHVAAATLLYVGIWDRWPVPKPEAAPPPESAPEVRVPEPEQLSARGNDRVVVR